MMRVLWVVSQMCLGFMPETTAVSYCPAVANTGSSYGQDVQIKIGKIYDPNAENILVQCIMNQCPTVCGQPMEQGKVGFQTWLKDGTVLSYLINSLAPKSVAKVQTSPLALKQMDQVSQFLKACEKYGIAAIDLFQTADLWEGKDMASVQRTLMNLGGLAAAKGDGYFRGDPNCFPKKSLG